MPRKSKKTLSQRKQEAQASVDRAEKNLDKINARIDKRAKTRFHELNRHLDPKINWSDLENKPYETEINKALYSKLKSANSTNNSTNSNLNHGDNVAINFFSKLNDAALQAYGMDSKNSLYTNPDMRRNVLNTMINMFKQTKSNNQQR